MNTQKAEPNTETVQSASNFTTSLAARTDSELVGDLEFWTTQANNARNNDAPRTTIALDYRCDSIRTEIAGRTKPEETCGCGVPLSQDCPGCKAHLGDEYHAPGVEPAKGGE